MFSQRQQNNPAGWISLPRESDFNHVFIQWDPHSNAGVSGTHSPVNRRAVHKPTEPSRIKQRLIAHPYDEPLDATIYAYVHTYIHSCLSLCSGTGHVFNPQRSRESLRLKQSPAVSSPARSFHRKKRQFQLRIQRGPHWRIGHSSGKKKLGHTREHITHKGAESAVPYAGIKITMMTSSNGNIFLLTGPLCGEFTGPGEFPAQRPVTRSFDVFFDLRLNTRLSKQPRDWLFGLKSALNDVYLYHILYPGFLRNGTMNIYQYVYFCYYFRLFMKLWNGWNRSH